MDRLHELLLTELRTSGLLDLDDASIDASHVRALKGGLTPDLRQLTAPARGSKRHLIVDRHGTPRVVSLTSGNRHDVTQLMLLIDAIPRIRGRRGRPRHQPHRLFADRGYDLAKYRRLIRARGITPKIARRGTPHGSGPGKTCWVIERTFAGSTGSNAFESAARYEPTSTSVSSTIVQLWENAWVEFVLFSQFDAEIRRIVCTTNAIESVNARIRRAVRARGHSPSGIATLKCVHLAVMSLEPTGAGRTRWPTRWNRALQAFDIAFNGRLTDNRT